MFLKVSVTIGVLLTLVLGSVACDNSPPPVVPQPPAPAQPADPAPAAAVIPTPAPAATPASPVIVPTVAVVVTPASPVMTPTVAVAVTPASPVMTPTVAAPATPVPPATPVTSPVKSAEYEERYEAIYAESRALGRSPEVSDSVATAYADKREVGESHDYAAAYAEAIGVGESDVYATAFAERIDMGKSETYSANYADRIDEGHSEIFATAFADADGDDGWIVWKVMHASAYEKWMDLGNPAPGVDAYVKGFMDRKRYHEDVADGLEEEGVDIGWKTYAAVHSEGFLEAYDHTSYLQGLDRGERIAFKYGDVYTPLYLISKLGLGSHDTAFYFADIYAWDFVSCCRGDVLEWLEDRIEEQQFREGALTGAAAYASQREKGESEAYSKGYAIARTGGESPEDSKSFAAEYEIAYDEQRSAGRSKVFANRYARMRAQGESHVYAYAYVEWTWVGDPETDVHDYATALQNRYESTFDGQRSIGKSETFADAYARMRVQEGRTHLYATGFAESRELGNSVPDAHADATAYVNSSVDFHDGSVPSSGRIAFTSRRDDPDHDDSDFIRHIYVKNADGSGTTRITDSGKDYGPSWSPDGQRIAFTSRRDDPDHDDSDFIRHIYVKNADSSGTTRITDSGKDYGPSWSPDGQRIAFTSTRHDRNHDNANFIRHIYVTNVDGSDTTSITDSGRDYDPSWSPDGQRIAFTSIRDDPDHDDFVLIRNIYVMNADGSGTTRITDSGRDYGPSWSPDGQRIAFTSIRDDPDHDDFVLIRNIYVMNADGSGTTRITDSGRDYGPSWSPDGQRIAFTSMRDDPDHDDRDWIQNIYVINADGSGLTRVTNSGRDYDPSWWAASNTPTSEPTSSELQATANTVNLSGTLDSDRWLFFGSAEHLKPEGVVQLTSANNDQFGILLDRQVVNTDALRVEFSFEIGGGSGADGLALVVLRSLPDFGQVNPRYHAGGTWGARFLEGFAVVFDTHRNKAAHGRRGNREVYYPIEDPSGNFVALASLGAGGDVIDVEHLSTKDLDLSLRNTGLFNVEVLFESDGHIKIHLSNDGKGMNRTLIIEHWIENYSPFHGYLGVIAGTGGLNDRHVIHSLEYGNVSDNG